MATFWERAADSVKSVFSLLYLFVALVHYENTSMQHTAIFQGSKNDNFRLNFFDYFHIFAQNIDCGYKLEPPH